MIDIHHLVYAGLLLVFLTGAALVALAGFLFACTGIITAVAIRSVGHRTRHGLLRRVRQHSNTPYLPLPTEVALAQAATGQNHLTNGPGNGPGTEVSAGKSSDTSLDRHADRQKTALTKTAP